MKPAAPTETALPEVTVKVPGKVMLAGEYTVLGGSPALAVTIDKHLAVRARLAVPGFGLSVGSELWPEPKQVGEADDRTPGVEPLVAAVARGARLFDLKDVALRVDSELVISHGVGSSSALRLATLLAMEELQRLSTGAAKARARTDLWPTARHAFDLQLEAQGQASGYDIATQLLGGLVRFRRGPTATAWPAEAIRLDDRAHAAMTRVVHVFVGGTGAPTTQLMGSTSAWLAESDRLARLGVATERLLQAFDQTFAATDPTSTDNLKHLTAAVGGHRQSLVGSPGYPTKLAAALATTEGLDESWSFKTTGAGGEDALLVVGALASVQAAETTLRRLGWKRLAAGYDTVGARISRGGRAVKAPRASATKGEPHA